VSGGRGVGGSDLEPSGCRRLGRRHFYRGVKALFGDYAILRDASVWSGMKDVGQEEKKKKLSDLGDALKKPINFGRTTQGLIQTRAIS